MTPDAPCQFVTERATEGQCETCGNGFPWNDAEQHAAVLRHAHSYLGPVLKRCGLPQDVHGHGFATSSGTHAYEPPPEEAINAR